MYKTAFDALEMCLHDMHLKAIAVVDSHWKQVMAMDKRAKTWEEKSRLQLSSFRSGNSLQLKWIGVEWHGRSTSRRQVKTSIPRTGGEFGYSMAKLKKWAKDWELPIVEATEIELQSLRKQAHFIVRGIVALRNAQFIDLKRQGVDTEANPEDVSDEVAGADA